MAHKQMHGDRARVLVARRYLAHGFLDVAMRLFMRNPALVEKRDWKLLAERLMERNRILDVVQVCELGGVPLPCEQLLGLGDGHLRRKDFEGAIRLYELGGADRARWSHLVDLLTAQPEQQRRAIALTERHLAGDGRVDSLRLVAAR